MKNKIDILEIINAGTNKNQEQSHAPDFDFLNVSELLRNNEETPALKAPAEPEAEPVPEPEPVIVSEPEAEPVPEPEPVIISELIPESEPDPVPGKNVSWKSLLNLAVPVIIVAALFLFAVGVPKIQANAMEPMISSGDRVVISKFTKNLQKDDIVLFRGADGEYTAARIVATKGDVVSLNNVGGLYINNELQNEEHIHTVTTITDPAVTYPVIVDEETYFVLGDNRTDSVDSRDSRIGLISADDIKGKIVFCYKKIK